MLSRPIEKVKVPEGANDIAHVLKTGNRNILTVVCVKGMERRETHVEPKRVSSGESDHKQ